VGADSYQNNRAGGFAQRDERPAAAPREGFSYERKGGFNDRFAGSRAGAPAPRGDFAPRADFGDRKPAFGKPAFSKPAFAKPGFAKPAFAKPAGKVFVPRDAAKKAGKFAKPARD
jgi:hypothetical protein